MNYEIWDSWKRGVQMENILHLESVSYRRKLREGYRRVMQIIKQEMILNEEKRTMRWET